VTFGTVAFGPSASAGMNCLRLTVITMIDSGPRLDRLSDAECEQLLESHRFGRMAVHGRDGLTIFPVNYVYSDGHLALRTEPGAKLDGAVQSSVAFEIDEVDDLERTGWSVVVTGSAYEVTDSLDEESRLIRKLPVDSWAGEKSRWLRIEPRTMTGRMVRRGGEADCAGRSGRSGRSGGYG
jgi:nitroimidazol reductase NimA-like FMN-containing flavoprotein (pyridoxamine 5'-phosphate oxidase superfamily)